MYLRIEKASKRIYACFLHSNEDIATVDVDLIPDHDLLVGGFPCQDYSVATTLKNSKGLIGKKGAFHQADELLP